MNTATPHVAILLSTYQGASYLTQQLDSIAQQQHQNWSVWVSDDGSTDDTQRILARYQAQWRPGQLQVFDGPRQGFCQNFLSLAVRPIEADYFAFCDQDDYWQPDRLSRAVAWLDQQNPRQPALYCGRTRLIDEANQVIGFSPLFSKPPAFENALVQSLAGGNTMTFNLAAMQLLRQAGRVDVQTHDWWLYLLVTGADGVVRYDPDPTVDYRQHGGNLVGSNQDWAARLERMGWLLKGRFRDWTRRNLHALAANQALLTPEHQAMVNYLQHFDALSLQKRLNTIKRYRLYRQTIPGTLGLFTAAALKRL